MLGLKEKKLINLAEAVKKAHTAAQVLYHSNPRLLKAADIISAFEGDPRFIRVKWSDVNGVPITKLCVLHGLCQARGKLELACAYGIDH